MKPLVVILPAVLVLNGVALFLLLDLEASVRTVILLSDLGAAALVGFILWRRHR